MAALTVADLWLDPMGLTPAMRQRRLKPAASGAHRELRRRVHIRDDFACRACGYQTRLIPENYLGRYAVEGLRVDHIIPWSRGGLTQSNNLQTLCERCNAVKRDRFQDDVSTFKARRRYAVYECPRHGLMEIEGEPEIGICCFSVPGGLCGEVADGPFVVEALDV